MTCKRAPRHTAFESAVALYEQILKQHTATHTSTNCKAHCNKLQSTLQQTAKHTATNCKAHCKALEQKVQDLHFLLFDSRHTSQQPNATKHHNAQCNKALQQTRAQRTLQQSTATNEGATHTATKHCSKRERTVRPACF